MGKRLLAAVLLAATTGCAHWFVNERLEAPVVGYRFDALASDANTDSLCVCIALSGGGMRAAALAYGVLEELRDTKISWDGKEKRLLDEVDCISAVSGGAFPATYFALFGDRVFSDEFKERFLERNLQAAVEWKVVRNSWWLWADLDIRRSELVSELYSETIFEEKTFGDLRRRPFLILNATDLTNGQRFEFTQDQFDLLSSDLGSFPIARAVTASAAFPVVLSTVTVANQTCLAGPAQGFELPRGVSDGLAAGEADPRLAAWARHQAFYADRHGPHYLHLTDGGVADNTGLRALWVALRRSDGFLRRRIESGRVRKLVVVSVNAINDPLRGLGDTDHPPNFATVLEKTARIGINNSTFETERLIPEDRVLEKELAQANVDLTFVEVSFDKVEDEKRRHELLGLPTGLSLEPEAREHAISAGKEVLRASAAYQRLLKDLKR